MSWTVTGPEHGLGRQLCVMIGKSGNLPAAGAGKKKSRPRGIGCAGLRTKYRRSLTQTGCFVLHIYLEFYRFVCIAV